MSVRLPIALTRDLDLREGDPVVLRLVDGRIVVERLRRPRLDAWLDSVDGSEVEVGAGVAAGREKFD